MKDLLIQGGRLLDPKSAVDGLRDVRVRDGKILEVADKLQVKASDELVDAKGLWILPGFIDLHVHLREPGEEAKETVLTGSRAAVAGGYTAVVAMPNTQVVNDSPLVTELVLRRAREANLCRVYPAGALSKGLKGEEMAEIYELVGAGCVCITDDGRPVMNAGLMRRVLQYTQRFNVPVMVHEEDLTLSAKGSLTEGAQGTRMGLLPIPTSAESTMVARDLVLLEEVGGRLHIAHVSCEASVRMIREAKGRGLPVTAEVAPHHFTLTDAAVEGYNTHAKMTPPLRHARDVQALREGLADGTLDAIATDHAPHGVLDKQVPYAEAANGVVGLETALPLALALVKSATLSASRMVELLTAGPARCFGLQGGHLGVGAPADVTLVDPSCGWTVEASRFHSKSRNTPFEAMQMEGRVVATYVDGRRVFPLVGEG